MKSTQKLLKRIVFILISSGAFLLLFNILLFLFLNRNEINTAQKMGPKSTAVSVSNSLHVENNKFLLSNSTENMLKNKKIWAMLINNHTGSVLWSFDLPSEIPLSYTMTDVAKFSRNYLKDYPVFVIEHKNGLLVLGYPKGSYWKLYNNYLETSAIKSMPYQFLFFILSNIFLIFLIYFIANTNLLRSVNPIINGIESLPYKEDVHVKESGSLSEIASCINKTSEVINQKDYELRKKDEARANWIAGVSHDIRTPLSIILGYASKLENNNDLSDDLKKQAEIIRIQSLKMKNLVNDLNLASKLEYNMQPVNLKKINPAAILRQTAADFLNSFEDSKYSIELLINENMRNCFILGDEPLLKRALNNLVQNSINHNTDGCSIVISAEKSNKNLKITVSDNGCGVSKEKLEKLKSTPHYMVCDSSTTEQRHGLGILIVQQIIKVHKGTFNIDSIQGHGFKVTLQMPIIVSP